MDTTGTITSFSPIPKTRGVTIGGDIYGVHTAGKSYSLTNPDSQTLQFTIQPGDAGPYDTSGTVDRSEICAANAGPGGAQDIPVGTPIGIDYQFMVQPNGPNNTFTNTASWFVTGEMHNDDSVSGVATSPPFAIQLAGNHLQVVARYCPPGGNPGNGAGSNMVNMVLWTDPNPIVPGRYYDINIQSKLSNTGAGGYLDVSIDGKQVVNYTGLLGYGAGTYWMDGLYRNAGPTETVTADFRNFTMVTGSTAVGWQGVGGTSSSGGTTVPPTPPAAPTRLADAAIVNGYVNSAQDTTTQQLTGSAKAGSTVSVYDGSSKLGTATAASDGSWSYALGHLADGSHSLTATATDATGSSAASAPLAFTVDTQAPVTPTLAAYSQAGAAIGSSTTLTDLVLKGTAEAGSTIKVSDGNTQIGTATAGSTGAWSFDTGTIARGSHSFTATATDIAGNTSAASAADAVTVAAPPPPPTAPTGLADAAIVNGYVNAAQDTTTQQLTGSAEAGSTVSVYDGSSKLGTATAASDGSWSYALGHLADGSHSLTATATDATGSSAASAPLAFTVDTQAPVTPTLAAYSQAGAAVGSSTTLTDLVLKGTAEAGSTIKVNDGNTQIGTVTTGSTGAWSFDTGTIAPGSRSFTATATDIAGNTSAASAADAVTVAAPPPPPAAPTAPTLTVASNSLYVSPGGSIPLGLGVSVPNAGDNVTVNISGLPKYETITDNLDGKTFSGSSVTLTAAEVNSGLSLSSSYQGNGKPHATLTVTATDNTGTPITSAAQTITVIDPPATTTSSGTSTTSSTTSATVSGDGRSWGQSHHLADVAHWLSHRPDFAHAATTLSDTGASHVASTPTMTTTDPAAGAVAKAYAVLNQMMAGDFGGESHFAQAETALSASSQQQANFLARPLH
ncbi:Ig-like domain-containing protein [Bradyrhizobium iriomotense]|uniref:Bacterial Ig-like domain-containing protein n=1 Tax=Bradyrhizobium iriomotense TaxID=441950 RepID=A0ABQ6AWG7_9BRAD|nr:Ig-like domain-containing protein [Bradyrhizobium iriomotense]GLR86544.1 hypothetical protein GCM10007857_32550 [Bradyrhizobium iriomotense]